jgi:hypothetical protein
MQFACGTSVTFAIKAGTPNVFFWLLSVSLGKIVDVNN